MNKYKYIVRKMIQMIKIRIRIHVIVIVSGIHQIQNSNDNVFKYNPQITSVSVDSATKKAYPYDYSGTCTNLDVETGTSSCQVLDNINIVRAQHIILIWGMN